MMNPRAAAAGAAAVLAALALAGCASTKTSAPSSAPSGWPVAPDLAAISSPFGAPRGRSSHQGIDLTAPRGTPVWATADGVVAFAGRSGSYGRLVVVDHAGGWQTRYAHLHRIRVDEGDRVRRGDRVGTVGRSGNASGDHLHYELRRNGVPIDPRPTLGKR